MLNVENLARPESTLPADGIYVPTSEDWAEANAHFDESDDVQDWEDDAYEEEPEWMDDEEPEYDYDDLYGPDPEFYEYDE